MSQQFRLGMNRHACQIRPDLLSFAAVHVAIRTLFGEDRFSGNRVARFLGHRHHAGQYGLSVRAGQCSASSQ